MKLTPARANALTVLLYGETNDRPVYESNRTTDSEALERPGRLTIYWQTRAWLTRNDLARMGLQKVALTDKGRRVAEDALRGVQGQLL